MKIFTTLLAVLSASIVFASESKNTLPLDLAYTMKTLGYEDRPVISADGRWVVYNVYSPPAKSAGSELDEEGIAYLKEDLDSPCTEEIAVFRAFAELVHRSEQEFVVIDTAPTGHTLLLLDSAEAYHREMSRSSGDIPESVKKLLPRLKNPNETGVVIVTLAEATPVIEAGRLQADLKRAKITPHWWVINQSLYAAHTKDPVLNGRAQSEKEWIKRVTEDFSFHTAIIPWMKEEKLGYEKLKDFLTLK